MEDDIINIELAELESEEPEQTEAEQIEEQQRMLDEEEEERLRVQGEEARELENQTQSTTKFKELVVEYHGEENTDIDDNNITIKYPSVTITDDFGNKEFLGDCYLTLHINNNYYLKVKRLKRTQLLQKHIDKDYLHSHIKFDGAVCLGGESDLNYNLSIPLYEHSEDSMKMILMLLEAYMSCESSSTGPYRRIKGLFNSSSEAKLTSFHELVNNSHFYRFGSLTGRLSDYLSIQWHKYPEGFLEFNKFIISSEKSHYFDSGAIHPLQQHVDINSTNIHQVVVFKGVDIPVTVTNTGNDMSDYEKVCSYNKYNFWRNYFTKLKQELWKK